MKKFFGSLKPQDCHLICVPTALGLLSCQEWCSAEEGGRRRRKMTAVGCEQRHLPLGTHSACRAWHWATCGRLSFALPADLLPGQERTTEPNQSFLQTHRAGPGPTSLHVCGSPPNISKMSPLFFRVEFLLISLPTGRRF